ncbi:hypothetical protein EST38_g4792 [Candolleomyces aberdarensis]|uniref:Uncharacterized protein n=1 Tax=Candolleomyces aberdarensis TaxID=2316362 RepID=A0A4Q2DM40_9AGAR|nr:hypothetical protein EST38_g4792 [Candolleomyces aberdarensis]
MVDFVSKNVGNALLYVQCDAILQPGVIRQARTILSNASRLKSVVINFKSMDGRALIDMFDAIGSTDNLEDLKIVAGDHFADPFEPFAGGLPSLRYLELIQFWVPWTSHLLQPTRLTHLLMYPAPPPTREFYNFLRRVPHLKTLHLKFIHREFETPSPYDAEPIIQLHSLESLEISGTPRVLCTLLGRVRISLNNISHLALDIFLSDQGEATAGINQSLLAWRHAIVNQHQDPVSPECIRLSKSRPWGSKWGFKGGKSAFSYAIQAWDTRYQNISLPTLLGLRCQSKTGLDYPPWANIEVRVRNARLSPYLKQFPFPNPVAFEQIWSLANLRILILNLELPRSYWPELALSLVLEDIHIPAANVDGFVEFVLEQWYPPLAPAGSQSAQIPFPALRLFIVGAVEDHLRAPCALQTARRVVDALEKRALSCGDSPHIGTSPKLDSLEFNSCNSEIDSETLSRMSALATNVLWDRL